MHNHPPGQIAVAILQLLVERCEFLVARLQFFPGRLQLFIGALQFLVGREYFLIRRLELFESRFVIFDQELQLLSQPLYLVCALLLARFGAARGRGPAGGCCGCVLEHHDIEAPARIGVGERYDLEINFASAFIGFYPHALLANRRVAFLCLRQGLS